MSQHLFIGERLSLFITRVHDVTQHIARLALRSGTSLRNQPQEHDIELVTGPRALAFHTQRRHRITHERTYPRQQIIEELLQMLNLIGAVDTRQSGRGDMKGNLPRFLINIDLAALCPGIGMLERQPAESGEDTFPCKQW